MKSTAVVPARAPDNDLIDVEADRPRMRGRPRKDQVSTINGDIRRVATRLFGERGYIGTSMDAVAAEVGISKRTLYTRFPDKVSLFKDVVDGLLSSYKDADPAHFPDLQTCLQYHIENYFVIRTDPAMKAIYNLADMAKLHLPEMTTMSQRLVLELGIKRIGKSIATTAEATGISVMAPEFVAASLLDLAMGHYTRVQGLNLRSDFASYKQAAERAVKLLLAGIAAQVV